MASINYAIREISVKIVYYGPGLSGKTTNLQVIHRKIPIDYRSDMVSLATETDRTLFFDFLPLDLGKIKGFSTKFQLYTVPGQVYYNATRKLVLRGVDGVVFVADSAQDKMQENLESFQNLHDNLAEYGYQQGSVPIVLQYNKRDLPNALPVDIIDKTLNKFGYQWNEAVASQGKGIFESLKIIGKIVIDTLNRKYSRPTYGAPVQQPAPQQNSKNQVSAPPFRAPQQPAPARQQQPLPAQSHSPVQSQQDIFRAPPQQQPMPRPPAAPQPHPQEPQAAQHSNYFDYGAINLEPMSQQTGPAPIPAQDFSANQESSQSSAEKTELDLEIEKYQREIEEKQRRLRNLQSAQSPAQPQQQQPLPPQQTQPVQYPAPQKGSYDVYEPLESSQEQIPEYPPQEQAEDADADASASSDEDHPLYFTSVNTDRQRKKVKRPVNPKTKAQGGFFGKMFNKDKPQ